MKERFASIRWTPEAADALDKLEKHYLSEMGVPIKVTTIVNIAVVKLAESLDLLIKEKE